MTFLLRHGAEKEGVAMDSAGYVSSNNLNDKTHLYLKFWFIDPMNVFR